MAAALTSLTTTPAAASSPGGGLQSTPTSTKAVLQALRALQAKISRLERERVAALNTATELRLKLEVAEARASEEVASIRCERTSFDRRVEDAERTARVARDELVEKTEQVAALTEEVASIRCERTSFDRRV
eukprot:CAMPEP_0118890520 /NCGR_PEP_ID=MMETSP1166-20130328/945_1 /TAXON_ID=1104430 /ORGANISM="Chrysoreinhardia sp, Strain CCMP3193" /LENGTH=131 /DNA_ID=CAMNT_0006829133 /DNA_START=16 /DNA_END=408 /DNA_ORIENTATION=+